MEAVWQNVVHDVGSFGFCVPHQIAVNQLRGGRIRMAELVCHGSKIHACRLWHWEAGMAVPVSSLRGSLWALHKLFVKLCEAGGCNLVAIFIIEQ